MGLGVSDLTNAVIQNYRYQQSKASNQSSHIDFNSVLSAKGADSTKAMQETAKTNISRVDEYTEYLKAKYGSVAIQSIGKDQKSLDSLGASTSGTGNVVIAPNILEEMANDPEKAAYYEKKIQYHFDTLPKLEAELSAMGHEIHSCGIVIHPDGTVTRYVSGDLKPEVRAKIEAKMKAEDEAKAKRRREYLERSEDAAEKRRQIANSNVQKHMLDEALKEQILASGKITNIEMSSRVVSAISAYENTINVFSRAL